MHARYHRGASQAREAHIHADFVVVAPEPAAADLVHAALHQHHLAHRPIGFIGLEGAPPPLVARVHQPAAPPGDGLAGGRKCVAGPGDERVLFAAAPHGHRAVERAASGLVTRHDPCALQAGRAHGGRPRRPLGGVEGEDLGEVVDGALHGLARVGRLPVGTGLIGRGAHAQEGLKVRERIVAAVRRHQEFPLLARAPLRDHPSHRVALDAGELDVGVRQIAVVDHPLLDLEKTGTQLLGRQSLVVREVLHDLARLLGREGHAVERDHPLQRALPSLRRLALEGDARHAPFGIREVARRAAGADGFVVDREAFLVALGAGAGGDDERACGDQSRQQARAGQTRAVNHAGTRELEKLLFTGVCGIGMIPPAGTGDKRGDPAGRRAHEPGSMHARCIGDVLVLWCLHVSTPSPKPGISCHATPHNQLDGPYTPSLARGRGATRTLHGRDHRREP